MTSRPVSGINRRRTITGAAAVAAGLPVLAACGEDDAGSATDTSGDTSGKDTGSASPSPSDSSSSPAAAEPLATTADVPVGGCFVAAAAKVVITQPTDGDFRAFSATCTHQGCAVSSSKDGVIPCNCHGSQFSIEDGSVLEGPASAALEAVEITVDGDSITLA